MAARLGDVRFTPKSGYSSAASKCPLSAKSGHDRLSFAFRGGLVLRVSGGPFPSGPGNRPSIKSLKGLCAGWGLSPHDLEQATPAIEMLAYTRYVLDTGMRGDLLALQVALAPCVIGYAEIAARLAARPGAHAETNPYRGWIAEYAGAPYQAVAAKARAHLERLADSYSTPAREAELIAIFKEATRLEIEFWEMAWRAGQRGE